MQLKRLRPDMAFDNIYTITPEVLAELGIKDDPLLDVAIPTDRMREYFDSLSKAGIKMAFVSNNKGPRVMRFNEGLGLFYVCKAGKPSPKGVRKCIAHFGLGTGEVLAVGDQIFTDCLAAHRAGIRFAMVKPIQKQESAFFRLKRFMERPFVRGLEWLSAKEAVQRLKARRKKKDGGTK